MQSNDCLIEVACDLGRISAKDARRMMSKINTGNGENCCWIWVAAKTGTGYGRVQFRRKMWAAHRVFYTIFVGEIPSHGVIMHTCDNPSCVNPRHLRHGTQQENIADCHRKKRHPVSINVLLSHEQARQIEVSKEGDLALSKKYNVSRGLIWKIKNGKVPAYKDARPNI